MRDIAVEIKVAEKRLNKIIVHLRSRGMSVTLVDVDVLEGSRMFTQAVLAFGKNIDVDRIKDRWDRDIQAVPDGCIEIITRLDNMEQKIEEEYAVWKEGNTEKHFIYFAENGRTFLTKSGDMRTMRKLVKGDIQFLAESIKRPIRPYMMVCNADRSKMKKNALASEIMGVTVKGPALICKEEIDEFGNTEYIGLTKNEIGVWRSKASKIRNSIVKKQKK